MSLHDHVWPALTAMMTSLVGVTPITPPTDWPNRPLMGFSEGEQDSVADWPWAWLVNSRDDFPDAGSADKEPSTYIINIRLLTNYTNDPANAERILMPLIEQVRQAFRSHIKMTPWAPAGSGISYARCTNGDWGYLPVSDNWYRSVDLICSITEKESKTYGA